MNNILRIIRFAFFSLLISCVVVLPIYAVEEKSSSDILQDFFSIFGVGQNTNSLDVGSLNPTASPSSSGSISDDPYIAHGDLIMYRQSDYTNTLPNGCTFNFAGCGPAAVANIVANLKNKSVTPVNVLEEYRTQGSFLGCSGSTMAGAKKVLEQSYGFTTFEIIPEGSAPVSIEQAAIKMLPFINAGNWVFIGANFPSGGHYAVITDIKETEYGFDLYALDSAYGNRNVIPVNYYYMSPYPKIKKAMAVFPN